MSGSLKNYKKQLNSLKHNKFCFDKHKIDKKKLSKCYQNLANSLNLVCEDEDCWLQDLIKYENWIVGEK